MPGYNYPTPSVPFQEGSSVVEENQDQDYNDYDPNDIPPDQARPVTGTKHNPFLSSIEIVIRLQLSSSREPFDIASTKNNSSSCRIFIFSPKESSW